MKVSTFNVLAGTIQHIQSGIVDGQDAFFTGKHNQTFLHVFQDQGNGILIVTNGIQLRTDGIILLTNCVDKRSQFIVKVGSIQAVQLVDGIQHWFDDMVGSLIREEGAHEKENHTGNQIQRKNALKSCHSAGHIAGKTQHLMIFSEA